MVSEYYEQTMRDINCLIGLLEDERKAFATVISGDIQEAYDNLLRQEISKLNVLKKQLSHTVF